MKIVESLGIDATAFIIVMGLLFTAWTVRGLRRWDSLLYYQKWMIVAELGGSIMVLLAGCVLLLKRLLLEP